MDMKKIIVLQGPPACGKSTKAQELLNQYGADKAVIVCRDSIREACESIGCLLERITFLI